MSVGSRGAPRDLRLVPAALVGYVTTWWLVAETALAASLVGVTAGVVGAAAVVVHRAWGRRAVLGTPSQSRADPPTSDGRARSVLLGTGQWALVCGAVVVLALVVAAQLHAGASGLLPVLRDSGAQVTVRGTVDSEPRPASAGFGGEPRAVRTLSVTEVRGRLDGVEKTGPVHGDVVLLGGAEVAGPQYGATVEVDGRLLAVDPGSAATAMLAVTASRGWVPSSEDDPEQGLDGEPASDSTDSTDSTGSSVRVLAGPGLVLRAVGTVRSSFVEVASGLPAQARGLVPGVAVGDTSMLSPGLDEALRVTSLTHITAVSGSHFAIIFATVTGGCALLRLPLRARVPVAAVAMAGFVLLVHPEPSVLRAAAMSAITLVALVLGRRGQAVAGLCTAVLVLLVVDPFLARSYGFVLSALGTAGLVLGTRPVAAWLGRVLPRWLAVAVAVPLSAQLACGPVIVLLDPSVATYSVPANLLAAPALVPATVLGVLGALLSPWWTAGATWLAQVAGWATWWIAEVAESFAAAPLARVPWVEGPPGAVLLAVVSMVVVVVVARWGSIVWTVRTGLYVVGLGRPPSAPREGWWAAVGLGGGAVGRPVRAAASPLRRPAAVTASVLVGLLVVWQTQPPWLAEALRGGRPGWDPDWQVAMCDVGQGDALVVQTSPGRAVMVDVGPPGDAAAHCLDELGVTGLDLLVLTHLHDDHVGGLAEVLDGREVRLAYVPTLVPPAQAEALAREPEVGDWKNRTSVQAQQVTSRAVGLLDDAAVPWEEVRAATHAADTPLLAAPASDTVRWEVLAPDDTLAGAQGERAVNDSSIVLAIRTPDLSVVALGDLETTGQTALLRSLERDGTGPVDIVKMAHHGSRTQVLELARLLDPRVVLVGVGADNTYGHPTVSALDLYGAGGATVLRTDTCGTVGVLVREGQTLVAGGCP